MASVTITLPPLLTDPSLVQRKVIEIAEEAAVAATTRTLGDVKKTAALPHGQGNVPKDRGTLARSLMVTPVRVQAGRVKTGMQTPLRYGPIMDSGRAPGRMRYGFLLYAPGSRDISSWRKGWIGRQMRPAVDDLARKLQSEHKTKHPKARKFKTRKRASRAFGVYQQRAALILAKRVSMKIARDGIRGREFLKQYAPGGAKNAEFVQRIQREFTATAKRRGLIE